MERIDIKVGELTTIESEACQILYERTLALNELLLTVKRNEDLADDFDSIYEKLVQDIGNTKFRTDIWWQRMFQKYNWPSHPDGQYYVPTNSQDVYLTYAENDIEL